LFTRSQDQLAGLGFRATIVLLALSALLITVFVLIESRTRSPLMPLRILRNRSVASADAVGLLVGAALLAMFFFLSLYLQQVLHYSALRTGVAYLPLAVGIIITAGLASGLTSRIGAKPVLIAGLVAIAGGMVCSAKLPVHGSYSSDVLGPSLIVALGLGFCFVPLTILAVSGTTEADAGLASGLINTAEQWAARSAWPSWRPSPPHAPTACCAPPTARTPRCSPRSPTDSRARSSWEPGLPSSASCSPCSSYRTSRPPTGDETAGAAEAFAGNDLRVSSRPVEPTPKRNRAMR